MASYFPPNYLTFKAAGAIPLGHIVKGGADREHVAVSALSTNKHIGVCMTSDVTTLDNAVEVAVGGGGGKAKLGGTVAFGDLLTSDANGKAVATTTALDRIVGIAMEDGVLNDLASIHVMPGIV